MQRKNFLKSCTLGVCSCFAFKALTPESVRAQAQDENPEVKKLRQQMDFVHKRFASLLVLMNSEIDAEKRSKMLEQLGRICSSEYKDTYMKFENDIEGFLNEIKGKWVKDINYDKENRTILITGADDEDCFCPLAKKSVTPEEYCNCSLGWQKGVFEGISGKKVNAQVEESVLRGGNRCSFKIELS
jgi:hypothetical protein